MLTDNGIPQLSSTTRIVVTVEDINDHAPEFDQKFYKVQIPVNAKVDQALFQVSKVIYIIRLRAKLFAQRGDVHFSLSIFPYFFSSFVASVKHIIFSIINIPLIFALSDSIIF